MKIIEYPDNSSYDKYMISPFTGRKIIDITNKKWHNLTALSPVKKPNYIKAQKSRQFWLFKCDCGNKKILDPRDIRRTRGPIKSCGCLKKKKREESKPKYFKDTSFEQISDNYMKYRIYNGERGGRRERGITFNLTKKDLWDLWVQQKGKCAYTNLDLLINFKSTSLYKECTASLDRIDSTKSYEIGNVEWVHKKINTMKNTLTKKEFINFCNLINKNNNYI